LLDIVKARGDVYLNRLEELFVAEGAKVLRFRKPNVVCIMTTNNLDRIDAGIQNRSVLVDMNLPPAIQWRPILRRIYINANLTPPPDTALDQVVIAGRGSARSIFTDVVMGANQAKRAGQVAVSKISNLRS
jgi:hypothetical protein